MTSATSRTPTRRFAALVVALGTVLTAAALAVPAGADTAAAVSGGPLLKTHARESLPRHGGTANSLNWSGYVVTPTGGGVTAVSSTLVVPKAGLLPPGFASTWTGIGGYGTSDLIQAGIAENSLPSNPLTGVQYHAWYELLPDAETPIANCSGDPACTVRPGDRVAVTITKVGANRWAIAMRDATRGWSWSKTVAYNSSQSSAEWILEAPTVIAQTLLGGVGTARFGPTSTFTTTSRGQQTIAQGNPTRVIMTPGIINEATPSALAANGQTFNDCAYRQTCPAP